MTIEVIKIKKMLTEFNRAKAKIEVLKDKALIMQQKLQQAIWDLDTETTRDFFHIRHIDCV